MDSYLIKVDGFDEAIIGIAVGYNNLECLAYDTDKVLEILSRDMSQEQAEEYFEVNIAGAYLGEHTPVFVSMGVII
jgi:hypothetical protein